MVTGVRARIVAILAVVAFTATSWWLEGPPSPVAASAPAPEFSAERAWRHLERITPDEPTPIGSTRGDEIRDYLVAELTRLGLRVEVERGTGAVPFGSGVYAGRVENVVATLPGTAPTGRVLLGAHYDSTFGTPGASDDKTSVAAILEAVRALVAGPAQRNDIVLMLTDGEEPGLLGAAAFAARHPERGVLVNGEAGGNAGASMLFQTSPGAAGVVATYAAEAPHPVGDSTISSVFPLLQSHTDLTVLGEAGYEGLTLGFGDGRAYYHSPLDTVANFDKASMQQHGENLLALSRAFAGRDLTALFSTADATFFTVLGFVVVYPNAVVLPLALLALAAVLALGLLAWRRGLVTGPRLLVGALAGLVPLAVVWVAGAGLWDLLVVLRPAYGAMFTGDPYRPELFRWALGALALTVVLAWCLLLRRRVGDAALVIGALVWPAALGVVLALTLPGAAFVATLPALLAAVGGIVLVAAGARAGLVALTAGIALGVLLVLGAGRVTLQIGGIAFASGAAVCFALAAQLALPLLTVLARVRVVLLTAALTVALVGAGLAVDRFDARHPEPTHLMYLLDADTGTARWAGGDAEPNAWVREHAPDRVDSLEPTPLPYDARPRWTGPAAAAALAAPELTVLGVRHDAGGDVVDLRLRSARDADVLVLAADRPVDRVTADGVGALPERETDAWPFRLQFYDPPAEGIAVRLELHAAAGMRLTAGDYTVGLAGLPGFRPRPPELVRSSRHDSDLVVVTTGSTLP